MTESPSRRLSADDWVEAALAAIGERGLAGVAVEPLASALGTTKGSFYWHFANRRALIDAALERWEVRGTTEIIEEVETLPDAATQIRALLSRVVRYSRGDRIEISLLSAIDDPSVRAALSRVTGRRIDYVTSLLRDLGCDDRTASRRASILVSLYLGHVQLAHTAPDHLPNTRDSWHAQVDDIVASFVPPSGG